MAALAVGEVSYTRTACDHRMHSLSMPSGLRWCPDCGALRYPESQRWQLPKWSEDRWRSETVLNSGAPAEPDDNDG